MVTELWPSLSLTYYSRLIGRIQDLPLSFVYARRRRERYDCQPGLLQRPPVLALESRLFRMAQHVFSESEARSFPFRIHRRRRRPPMGQCI